MPGLPDGRDVAGPRPRVLPPLRPVLAVDPRVPAVAGIAGLVAVAVVADVWAARSGKQTISSFVAEVSAHPIGGPVVAAVIAGLVHHLAIDPVIRRLEPPPVRLNR